MEQLHKLLRSDPDDSTKKRAMRKLGRIYRLRADFEPAAKILNEALAIGDQLFILSEGRLKVSLRREEIESMQRMTSLYQSHAGAHAD